MFALIVNHTFFDFFLRFYIQFSTWILVNRITVVVVVLSDEDFTAQQPSCSRHTQVIASLCPPSAKPGAFIHTLQHLTEDRNGVLGSW